MVDVKHPVRISGSKIILVRGFEGLDMVHMTNESYFMTQDIIVNMFEIFSYLKIPAATYSMNAAFCPYEFT